MSGGWRYCVEEGYGLWLLELGFAGQPRARCVRGGRYCFILLCVEDWQPGRVKTKETLNISENVSLRYSTSNGCKIGVFLCLGTVPGVKGFLLENTLPILLSRIMPV
jgi:hypothetical protein